MNEEKKTTEEKLKEVTDDLKWKSIEHETFRIYRFPEDEYVLINEPRLLHVSRSGGHRVLDADNTSHYIPSGWIHLYWTTDDGSAFWF